MSLNNCLKVLGTQRIVSQSSRFSSKTVATFDDVRSVENDGSCIVIDVRESRELQETGVIPGSINIPLGEIESTLKLPNDEFLQKIGKPKPETSQCMIFSCRSGRRSANAQEIAKALGYSNTMNYEGGWLDWEEKIKDKC